MRKEQQKGKEMQYPQAKQIQIPNPKYQSIKKYLEAQDHWIDEMREAVQKGRNGIIIF